MSLAVCPEDLFTGVDFEDLLGGFEFGRLREGGLFDRLFGRRRRGSRASHRDLNSARSGRGCPT
ncbi:MAG: hypothetical protein ABFS46_12710, partial [Myxococcota bacterium]